MKRLYTIFLLLFALTGCSGFLEEYSQDQAYVEGYDDLDELLLGNAYFERNQVMSWYSQGNSGDLYYPWIHVLADELEQETESDSWGSGIGQATYGYATWQRLVYQDWDGDEVWDDGSDYRNLYAHINACNTILGEIGAFENTDDEDDLRNINRIKGESYFLRGSCYFLLANFYGAPYAAASAATDPAVPIKLTNYVEDRSYPRRSVADVYAQVLSDLREAERYLEGIPQVSVWRADLDAARLMLSRVYLYMCDYENAARYARMVVENGPELADLNTFTGDMDFLDPDLSELIFSTGASSLPGGVISTERGYTNGDYLRISDELYESFHPENPVDLRLEWYVKDTTFSGYPRCVTYRKSQGSTYSTPDMSDVFVLRTSEAYLNLAEAAACMGDVDSARLVLNELRQHRIRTDAFDPSEVNNLSGEELVSFVREERRRELCLEGHRWFDLRRYRVAEAYPQEVTLTKVVTNKVQDPNTYEYSVQWRRRFTLPNDDPAWVLPLPHEELTKNPGMLDNPRSDRSFELIN